jgi:hexosaminidase
MKVNVQYGTLLNYFFNRQTIMTTQTELQHFNLIPMPVSVEREGGIFTLSPDATIYVEPGNAEIDSIGRYLADRLNRATGYSLRALATAAPPRKNVYLTTQGSESALGDEGYQLTITTDLVTLVANSPAGLFYGVQTLRQLFSPTIELAAVQPGPWTLPAGVIRDYPRFGWRGAMLDVARHFFKVEDIKHYIDLMAYYKLNRLHLHLTDDQGWRIMINAWPDLARIGGSTGVGGFGSGFYTQDEYADLVAYARSRFITIVPEIDMPGHTNAALASYPELNCDGITPALYTGTQVGFSSLCVGKAITYRFVEDVIREIVALTPGPWLHIGGDESDATSLADYRAFIERVESLVNMHGKRMIGWGEITEAELSPTTIAQHWRHETARQAVAQGMKVIMSPAGKTYLDMKYDSSTSLGADWAGLISIQAGYDWDPAAEQAGVPEEDILGIEAPIWSESFQTFADVEYMAFPRLLGYAEIGWTPQNQRNWDEYRTRLAAHGPRLTAMGVNFYRDPGVSWL